MAGGSEKPLYPGRALPSGPWLPLSSCLPHLLVPNCTFVGPFTKAKEKAQLLWYSMAGKDPTEKLLSSAFPPFLVLIP